MCLHNTHTHTHTHTHVRACMHAPHRPVSSNPSWVTLTHRLVGPEGESGWAGRQRMSGVWFKHPPYVLLPLFMHQVRSCPSRPQCWGICACDAGRCSGRSWGSGYHHNSESLCCARVNEKHLSFKCMSQNWHLKLNSWISETPPKTKNQTKQQQKTQSN